MLSPERLRKAIRRGVFTTGEVARITSVSPRTVSSWIDKGRLPGAYRIPGSSDRRVPLKALVAFLLDNKMPVPSALSEAVESAEGTCVVYAHQFNYRDALRDIGFPTEVVSSSFALGKALGDVMSVSFLIVDLSIGKAEALQALDEGIRGKLGMVLIVPEDMSEYQVTEYLAGRPVRFVMSPYHPQLLAENVHRINEYLKAVPSDARKHDPNYIRHLIGKAS